MLSQSDGVAEIRKPRQFWALKTLRSKYTAKSLFLILCLSEGFGIQRFAYEGVKRTLSVNIEIHFQARKIVRGSKMAEGNGISQRI